MTIHLVMDFMTVILQDEIMDLQQEIMVSFVNCEFLVLYKYILYSNHCCGKWLCTA